MKILIQIISKVAFCHVFSLNTSVPSNYKQEKINPLTINCMDTTTLSHQSSAEETQATSIWTLAEASRYGINMLVIALVIIPGSMAAPYAVNLGDWQFALVLFPSMFTLLLVLGLAPIRMIVSVAAFALVMNLAMFVAGAIGS